MSLHLFVRECNVINMNIIAEFVIAVAITRMSALKRRYARMPYCLMMGSLIENGRSTFR